MSLVLKAIFETQTDPFVVLSCKENDFMEKVNLEFVNKSFLEKVGM